MESEGKLLWPALPHRGMAPELNLPLLDCVFLGKLFSSNIFLVCKMSVIISDLQSLCERETHHLCDVGGAWALE